MANANLDLPPSQGGTESAPGVSLSALRRIQSVTVPPPATAKLAIAIARSRAAARSTNPRNFLP